MDAVRAERAAAVAARRTLGTGRVEIHPRLLWWLAFLVFLAVAALWSLASPLFSYPDEGAHAIYAAGTARGELLQPANGVATPVRVPAVFENAWHLPDCYIGKPTVPAGCASTFAGSTADKEVLTSAGRYPPAYYLLVGVPTLTFPSARGIYLARLLTALMCAALLAGAVLSAVAIRRPALLAGLAVALTPMALYFAGGVNPQGLEICAAVAVWVSGIGLLGGPLPASSPAAYGEGRLIARLALSAAVLALSRPLSPLWLALIAVVLVLAFPTSYRLREVLRRRDARWWLGGLLGVGVAAIAWLRIAGSFTFLPDGRFQAMTVDHAAVLSYSKIYSEVLQMIGVFGSLDTDPPALTWILWLLCLGVLTVLGLAVARLRFAAAILVAAVGSALLPVGIELLHYRQTGFSWQGRYTLPLAVGLPLLAAYAVGRAGVLLPWLENRLVVMVAILTGIAHVVAFLGVFHRYLYGVAVAPWKLAASGWHPPLPAWLLAGAFVVVAVAYVWALAALPARLSPAVPPPKTQQR